MRDVLKKYLKKQKYWWRRYWSCLVVSFYFHTSSGWETRGLSKVSWCSSLTTHFKKMSALSKRHAKLMTSANVLILLADKKQWTHPLLLTWQTSGLREEKWRFRGAVIAESYHTLSSLRILLEWWNLFSVFYSSHKVGGYWRNQGTVMGCDVLKVV